MVNMENITLKRASLNFLRMTLEDHRKFLHQVKMPDLVKKALLADVEKMRSVISEAKDAGPGVV